MIKVLEIDKIVYRNTDGSEFDYENYPSYSDKGTGKEWLKTEPLSLEQAKALVFEISEEAYDYVDEINEAEDLQELENVLVDLKDFARDNTYNTNWWGGVVDFGVLTDSSSYGEALIILRMHRGGDPRGNYSEYEAFKLESYGEEFPPYADTLTYQLTTEDGIITLDTDDFEGYNLRVVSDETGTYEEDDYVSLDDIEDDFDLDGNSLYGFGGGIAVGGIVGAYLGYKVGRSRPQKKGFETEKKIARKVKETAKDLRSKKETQKMAKGGMTISKIKTLTQETSPNFFDRKTLKFFGQTMRDFKVYKQPNGKYLITAPTFRTDYRTGKRIKGLPTQRLFNPETNELERLPREYEQGGSVKENLAKADSHLREVGSKLFENKNPKEPKFRKAKNKFDDSVDDLFTRRELSELGYAKGGKVEEIISLKSYNLSGKVINSGDFIVDYENETITFPSGKTYKVVEDYEYTYKILKTKIRATGGIKGFVKFLNDINRNGSPFNPSLTNSLINKDKFAKGGELDVPNLNDGDFVLNFKKGGGVRKYKAFYGENSYENAQNFIKEKESNGFDTELIFINNGYGVEYIKRRTIYSKGGEIPSEREIVEYYGQDYDNVSHMRGYVKELVERYKEENGFNEVYGRFKDDIRKSFGGDNMAEGGKIKRAEIMLIDDDRGEYAIYDLDKKEFIEKGYSLSSEAEMDAKEMGYNEIDGVRVDGSTYAEGGNITYDLSDVI